MADVNSVFDLHEFKPLRARWYARQAELERRYAYYSGEIYAQARGQLGWLYPRLQGSIRPLYLPLARAVNVDAGIIPGGWTLAEGARHLQSAVQQVMTWSDWSTLGILYTHFGALYGNVGLSIADLREQQRVVIRPVPPTSYLLMRSSPYDDAPRMVLLVGIVENSGTEGIEEESFEYAQVIEPERVRTFANGKPHGFNGRPPEYPNTLGFVPFVEVQHIHSGGALGDCAFERSVTLLDEVNELATWLAEIIRKHANPQWAVIGSEETELERDSGNVWFIPAGGDVKVVVPGIDVAGVLKFLQEVRNQVQASLPELAFDDLRSKDQIATATVELQLMELTLLIKRVRPNYDHGLVHALRMCGRAAASMLADGVTSSVLAEVASLDSDDLLFDERRSVLPPDAKTQLEIERMEVENERLRNS